MTDVCDQTLSMEILSFDA